LKHRFPFDPPKAAQNDGLWAVANYIYDGLGHRFRIQEIGSVDNKTFTFDALLMYDEVSRNMAET